jgi:hypothetical protein
VRIHGSDLTLTYFRHHELLAGCLATHKHVPASTLTNNGARRDSRFYVSAPSDGRSGLSFVIVIVRPLFVNLDRFTCNVTNIRIYNMYKAYVSPG